MSKEPKEELQVVITDKRVIQYFKDNLYDPTKWITATILDKIDGKIISANQGGSKMLKTEDLIEFNNEYGIFQTQKEAYITLLKKTYYEHKHIIDNMKLEQMDTYFAKTFDNKKTGIICDICNIKSFPNRKGLSVHQRKCRVTHMGSLSDNEEIEEDDGAVEN
jgi:hypothetical protein